MMDLNFTTKDGLEEYLWLVFYNAETKPDADWCKPSRHVWEKVAAALKENSSFSKKVKPAIQPFRL